MSVEEFRKLRDSGQVNKKGPVVAPGKSKFGNNKVEDPDTGESVDSETEMGHRTVFRKEYKEGKIRFYSRQPEFYIPKKDEKYIADHLWMDGMGVLHAADSKSTFTVQDKKWQAKFNRAQREYPEVLFHVIVGKKFAGTEYLEVGLPKSGK